MIINNPILATGSNIREENFGGILRAPILSVLKTGQTYYKLSEVEFFILSLCNGNLLIKEIAQQVSSEFESNVNTVFEDITNYLNTLYDIGIIQNFGHKEIK